VRYNAEKKQVGKYFSTKIWNFRMKCHLCDNYIEIQTDPKGCDYVVVSGATRKNEEWEAEDNETIKLKSDEEAQKMIGLLLFLFIFFINVLISFFRQSFL